MATGAASATALRIDLRRRLEADRAYGHDDRDDDQRACRTPAQFANQPHDRPSQVPAEPIVRRTRGAKQARPDVTRRRRSASGWRWIGALAALIGLGLALDRLAPAQDVPWKLFDLNRPLGWATHVQLARIGYDQAACTAALAAGDVDFTPVPDRFDGACHVLGGVRLGEETRFRCSRPRLDHELPGGVGLRRLGAPCRRTREAVAILGRGVARIDALRDPHNCRPIRGDPRALSEHAFANAIDVSGFDLTDGRQVSVLKDYRNPGPPGHFLHRIHDRACMVFPATALGPDFNADHKDHLHLDMGLWGPCR